MVMLEIDDIAPEFFLSDQNGVTHSLGDHFGEWVVIYFYPKDDTPGCTKEACTIGEVYDEFEDLNVTVYGVSKDTTLSHAKFALKYRLPFLLLSDESGEMINAYGALQEKSMFGKKYMGIVRMTYIVGPDGRIAKIYPKVDPATHAHQILQDLRKLVK
jgi:peroxiredoxin Q/BCP